MGSSPLTRGKRRRRQTLSHPRRLIPAHAGKTFLLYGLGSPMTAHPRSRGENAYFDWVASIDEGSSPLTRGKHAGRHADDPRQRLIPAHAGKTSPPRTRRAARWAHPRSRGENGGPGGGDAVVAGSSPLTRGKHRTTGSGAPVQRLIPAHAGKTDIRHLVTRV